MTGSRQLNDVHSKLRPVRAFFDHYRLVGVDHTSIMTYMSQRQALPFPNPRKGRFQASRLRDFRKAWLTTCKQAGLTGMLRHDFRRSAVGNFLRSGVGETVVMTISGHKTRSVFDRYNITSDSHLREAAPKLHGHNTGTLPAVGFFNPLVSMLNASHAPIAQLDRAAAS